MSLTPILLIAVIIAVDADLELPLGAERLDGWMATLAALGPILLIVAATWLAMAVCGRRLRKTPGPGPIIAAARIASWARGLIIVQHAVAVLALGWLTRIRDVVGDPILLDEVLCLAGPVIGFMGVWWAHYPIERRQREALLLRRIDRGGPVYPIPGRGGHVLIQARAGLFLLLVPLLLILASTELLDGLGGDVPTWVPAVGKLATTLGVFALAPLLVRLLLHVEPLPEGDARDDLTEICRGHRVTVREILLWHTGGTIINAAVMGLLGPLRFVLLTDALMESMSREQIRAVMAHEVAHVRRRHMPWLVVSLLACLSVSVLAVELPLLGLRVAGWVSPSWPVWLELLILGIQVAAAMVMFGWISRRFERQADTFATQHLSGEGEAVTADAVDSMRGALGRIARLNTMDPRKHSWRHGSIAWRQAYLSTLVDRPVAALPIDRLVRRIKLVAGVVLAGAVALNVAAIWLDRPAPPAATDATVAE